MIEKLKKGIGISNGPTSDCLPSHSYNYVEYENNIVGVGYFEHDNDDCITAIITNSKGEKEILNELEDGDCRIANGINDELEFWYKAFIKKS